MCLPVCVRVCVATGTRCCCRCCGNRAESQRKSLLLVLSSNGLDPPKFRKQSDLIQRDFRSDFSHGSPDCTAALILSNASCINSTFLPASPQRILSTASLCGRERKKTGIAQQTSRTGSVLRWSHELLVHSRRHRLKPPKHERTATSQSVPTSFYTLTTQRKESGLERWNKEEGKLGHLPFKTGLNKYQEVDFCYYFQIKG